MELQFDTIPCPCLKNIVWKQQSTEQTQELKLPDGMPDIGRTLGAWGQCMLRSKQWNSEAMILTGGVTAWVLYVPEDGSEARSMETWIPFTLRWELPKSDREGVVHVQPYIIGMDARTLSARKMMLRVTVGATGKAMIPEEERIPAMPEQPSDAELYSASYPVMIPREAGEKNFTVEDLLDGQITKNLEKVISCTIRPEGEEQKIVGNKIAFHGNVNTHILYTNREGRLESADQSIPFSQYTELDRDYGNDASAEMSYCVTSLETETAEDGKISIKCGIVGQYQIFEQQLLTLPEDGYSLNREMKLKYRALEIPVYLDRSEEILACEQKIDSFNGQTVDVQFYHEQPVVQTMPDSVTMLLGGNFGILYYDEEGILQSGLHRWQQDISMNVSSDGEVCADVQQVSTPKVSGNGLLRCDLQQTVCITGRKGFPVLAGMEIGEKREKDPQRPSLILERAGTSRLWEIAKRCGSTMDAIRKLNNFEGEPEEDRMLLIPVL